MNEGQNDNLSTKSLPTYKPARTISSACTSAVCVYERERERQTNHAERDIQRGGQSDG